MCMCGYKHHICMVSGGYESGDDAVDPLQYKMLMCNLRRSTKRAKNFLNIILKFCICYGPPINVNIFMSVQTIHFLRPPTHTNYFICFVIEMMYYNTGKYLLEAGFKLDVLLS